MERAILRPNRKVGWLLRTQHSMNIWEIGLGDKAQYDGILTSGELGNLNLSKTRLVTLSACSSGRGSSTHGQGVSGMRQSLALAGVRNILMTHWPVPIVGQVRLWLIFTGQI